MTVRGSAAPASIPVGFNAVTNNSSQREQNHRRAKHFFRLIKSSLFVLSKLLVRCRKEQAQEMSRFRHYSTKAFRLALVSTLEIQELIGGARSRSNTYRECPSKPDHQLSKDDSPETSSPISELESRPCECLTRTSTARDGKIASITSVT